MRKELVRSCCSHVRRLTEAKIQEAKGAGTLVQKAGSEAQKASSKTRAQKHRLPSTCFNAGQMDVTGLYPFLLNIRQRWKLKSGDLLNLLVKNTYSGCSIFILTAAYALILLLKGNTVWT